MRLLPRSRMGIFTAALVVLWLLRSLIVPRMGAALSPGLLFSLDLIPFLLIVPAFYYLRKALPRLCKKLLWKIRSRLILVYAFIGLIPFLLVLIILNVAALLFYYQLIYYLVSNQIKMHSAQIHGFNASLRARLQKEAIPGRRDLEAFKSVINQDAQYLLGEYPSAEITVHIEKDSNGRPGSFCFRKSHQEILPEYQPPAWAAMQEFSGLVVDDSMPPDSQGKDPTESTNGKGHLCLKSLVFSNDQRASAFSLEISVPLDRYMLEQIKAALGPDLLLAEQDATSSLNVMRLSSEIMNRNVLSATFDVGNQGQLSVGPVWSIVLSPVSWRTGGQTDAVSSDVLFVEVSIAKLIQNLFRVESSVSKTIIGVLQIVIGFFLIVEIMSVVIGVLLTRSITGAVYNLDRGTEFIRRGDFTHRIKAHSDDQLGALAKSFNRMTEYIQDLVGEHARRERLERELEIAKEVQERSFPREAPEMSRLQLAGYCLPARIVSGDYYDFLPLGASRLGMALGDICGKGISAALLMANLQATLRSNVLNFSNSNDRAGATVVPTVAQIVQLLNRQIYNYTASNKFATFFYAVYDDDRPALTYCNAGHNPPLYFDAQGGVKRLTKGGTVIGIFPDAAYEQATVELHSDDLIVAYTDGIIESVNEYGEEFGEDRLIEIVEKNRSSSAAEIQRAVMDGVLKWAFEKEQDDDMTILVGKVISDEGLRYNI